MKRATFGSISRAILISFILSFSYASLSQWTSQASNTDYDLYSVYFVNSSTGFLASSKRVNGILPYGGQIIRTSNGGENWQQVFYEDTVRLRGFYFFDANTGFAVGGYYAEKGYILKTTNSGFTWTNIPYVYFSFIHNIQFVNSFTGYAGGTNGVYKSTDGGNTWNRVLVGGSGTLPPWGKISFVDANTGFYGRDTNTVYKTTNGGLNWQPISLTLGNTFRDIKFIDNNTGYVVGGDGAINKSTNQGGSWILLNPGISQRLFSVFFTDINTGYVTAETTVLKTTNSGVNWFSVFSFQADTIFSAYFLNSNTGYISCDEGRVYKTTTGGVIGINQISNKVPKDFLLFQNYPNPFNPNTNIRFAVARAGNVKLVIFDMLGSEIESIVNQSLTPGTYEVSWDASGYSSGIYFYRILAGDFVSVKKMSLMK